MCLRYNHELVTVDSICKNQPLGMLYLMLEDFQSTAMPEPKRLLEIVKEVIPW